MAPLLLLAAHAASAHVPVVYITNPTEDWCQVVADALGGDIIMLEAGTYTGPCSIDALPSDPQGELTTLQSLDPADPAVLTTTGDHVLSVGGARLVLLQLRFEDLGPDVDVLRVDAPIEELFVRFSWFERLEGDVLSWSADAGEVTFEDNEVRDVPRPVTLGCPDGSCALGTAVVHENLWVDSGGLHIAPGVVGEARDNVVVGAPAVGLQLGPSRADGQLLVERNLVEGPAVGVQIDGGPTLFRNNVVLGGTTGLSAAGAQVADVALVGNTVLGSPPLDLAGWDAGRGLRLIDNATDADLPDVGGAERAGNVGCPDPGVCFTDAAAWDVYPAAGSPLRGASIADGDLVGDWCGRARQDPPTAGALEGFGDTSMGPLEPVFKDDFDCTLPDDPTTTTPTTTTEPQDTAPPADTGTTDTDDALDPGPPDEGDDRCGCASTPAGAGIGVWVLGALFGLRRRRTTAGVLTVLGAWLVAPVPAEAHQSAVWILEPGDDYCAFLRDEITPGDLVKLAPGTWRGPCEITGGVPPEAGELTILESLDPDDPAVIVGDGTTPYVLAIEGQDVWVNGLTIEGVAPDGAAVEVRGGVDLQVRFLDVRSEGHGVRVVGDTTELSITDNRLDVAGDAVQVCESDACTVEAMRVGDNLVVGSDRGLVLHGASEGGASDNVVVAGRTALDLSGDVEVSGTWGVAPTALVARSAEVVAHTDLLEGAVELAAPASLWASTVVGDVTAPEAADLRSNLVVGALPAPFDAVEGNVACAPGACVTDAAAADFRPVEPPPSGSAIEGLDEDFCGLERTVPPAAGAFATADEDWALVVDFKKDQDCGRPSLDRPGPDPTTTDETTTTDGPNADPGADDPAGSDPGCGCRTSGGGSGLVLLWAALVNIRRRRDTTTTPTGRGSTAGSRAH